MMRVKQVIGSIFAGTAVVVLMSATGTELVSELQATQVEVVAPEWSGMSRWVSKTTSKRKNELVVFRSGAKELRVIKPRRGSYFDENKEIDLVMVSASKHTNIGKQLMRHPRALAVYDDGRFYNQVLVDVSHPEDRDDLATLAHQDLNACGALIPVSLDQPLVSTGSAISPIWSTLTKLTAANNFANAVSATHIQSNVKKLESLGSRFHAGANAAAAVAAVKDQWQAVLPSGASITEQSNSSSSQTSLVLSIPGTSDNINTVILGAHLDSINRSDQTNAPGADDDASGIAVLTELLRSINSSGLQFKRKVEFHAYAAEEVGLVGSNALAKSYAAAGRSVAGMLQLDMVGYANSSNTNKIWLVTTDTSSVLRQQLKDVLGSYLGGNYGELSLSAGSSDHRSWTSAGYHAVFPFEHPQDYNHNIHSDKDTSSLLNFSQAARFGKLAAIWLSHVAGITGADQEHLSQWTTLTNAATEITLADTAANDTTYYLSGSASKQAASFTSCIVENADAKGCAQDPVEYTLGRTSDTKGFFGSNVAVTLSADEFHRFVAYDAAGVAIAQRTVKLRKK